MLRDYLSQTGINGIVDAGQTGPFCRDEKLRAAEAGLADGGADTVLIAIILNWVTTRGCKGLARRLTLRGVDVGEPSLYGFCDIVRHILKVRCEEDAGWSRLEMYLPLPLGARPESNCWHLELS